MFEHFLVICHGRRAAAGAATAASVSPRPPPLSPLAQQTLLRRSQTAARDEPPAQPARVEGAAQDRARARESRDGLEGGGGADSLVGGQRGGGGEAAGECKGTEVVEDEGAVRGEAAEGVHDEHLLHRLHQEDVDCAEGDLQDGRGRDGAEAVAWISATAWARWEAWAEQCGRRADTASCTGVREARRVPEARPGHRAWAPRPPVGSGVAVLVRGGWP